MTAAFVHGFLLSLGLILPIGMQNGFILMQGALHRGRGWLPAVVTASLCDTLLIALAVLGVSAVALHIGWVRYTLGFIGGAFLLYMGWSTWRDGQEEDAAFAAMSTAWTPKRQMGFATSVSLLNPHALIDTLAVIGGSASAYSAWAEKLAFGTACAALSWLWFFGLAGVGHVLGRRALQTTSLRALHRIAAGMMWASALYLGYILYTFR
ncbi:LysE/ArgO family amino acid transporter [Alicyclobacillus shizuokensis]|uniref:LysE/ArgO family amino acid transporter n=1 Tax=Alicyclobacillus shizuokensis TaxID=392014 RepID=UPI0009F99570|nr:LysE family transporter [Alicyclobacillus shizuokensis]MCL6627164.1 LysE family transporter [Alicyclobacillus shizuokensis]